MKAFRFCFFLILVILCGRPGTTSGQTAPEATAKSAKKAFVRSLLIPGMGHRYAHNGSWKGTASLYVLVDVGLWVGLAGTSWQLNHLTDQYETLAAERAGAYVDGKNRTFFLNLATFHSSDEYLEVQLRNRNWDQLDYVSERPYQWSWQSEDDFQRFRKLRNDSESNRRRVPIFIALMVGNRLISGIMSVRAVNKVNQSLPKYSLALKPAPSGVTEYPMVNLHVSW